MSNNENFNPSEQNQYLPKEEPKNEPNAGLEVLIGLGLSALFYGLVIGTLALNIDSMIIKQLVDFVFLIAAVFIGVRLTRRNHKIAGIILLCLLAPLILFMLLFGACALLLMNY